MSQLVGYEYRSKIPSFSDDASIVEALRVYHYGVDNWSTEPIPDDSIEGNFRVLHNSINTINASLNLISGQYVEKVSLSANPNIITAQNTTTIPITIRSIASQTTPLLQWENSSSATVGSVSTGGFMNLSGYLTVGVTTQSTTTGINVNIINSAHKGIVVKAQSGQTANLQEWQNSSGSILSWVDRDAKIHSNGEEVTGISGSFFLMGS